MIRMNMDILNIINVVLDYKRFLVSYHMFVLKEKDFDFLTETRKFYNSLELPEGMNNNIADFEAILSYGSSGYIDKLNTLEPEELEKENWKNF